MEIKFKATRKKHDSGWAEIQKSGNLEFDRAGYSSDVIVCYLKDGGEVKIDCDFKTKEFRLMISDNSLIKSNDPQN